jgi:hypothetical protein
MLQPAASQACIPTLGLPCIRPMSIQPCRILLQPCSNQHPPPAFTVFTPSHFFLLPRFLPPLPLSLFLSLSSPRASPCLLSLPFLLTPHGRVACSMPGAPSRTAGRRRPPQPTPPRSPSSRRAAGSTPRPAPPHPFRHSCWKHTPFCSPTPLHTPLLVRAAHEHGARHSDPCAS